MLQHKDERSFGTWPAGCLSVIAAGFFAAFLGASAAAQQPPTPRVEVSASLEIEDSPRQYDLVQMLVEFPPGAANALHRVNGRALFTVLSGEITRIEENGETTVFKTGQTFRESDSDHFDIEVNNGTVPAQLLSTFLLQPGAPPLLLHPDARPPSAGPRILAGARTTVGTIPAQFTFSHGIIVNQAGGIVPAHSHDGWQMVTTLAGEPLVILGGEVHSGATFVDRPGLVHEGNNPGPGPLRVMFASLNPKGSPPARPVAAGQQGIRPPATGDGGLGSTR